MAATFPPTPAPSTDISGKPNSSITHLDSTFTLPPAALSSIKNEALSSSSSTTSNASDSSYRPLSPPSPVAVSSTKPTSATSRRRSAASQKAATKDDYNLPPPPTRSRKIIQMKPRAQDEVSEKSQATTAPSSSKTASQSTGAGNKRKTSGTTAAGRKIARKTAHSLIERRRRSKMNEEFAVLKNMIPACAGQEMHKLAILQASIEYMQYLEQCVTDLKASRYIQRETPVAPQLNVQTTQGMDEMDDDKSSSDEEMSDAEVSPKTYQPTSLTPSPAIFPTDPAYHSHNASPAIAPNDLRHYSLVSSIRSSALSTTSGPSPQILPLPAMNTQPQPSPHQQRHSVSSVNSTFVLTSPALRPEPDEDREATAALLMLNADRRNWNERGKALSVRDLLSG